MRQDSLQVEVRGASRGVNRMVYFMQAFIGIPAQLTSVFTIDRLPRRPFCFEEKGQPMRRLATVDALRFPYIQVNPTAVKFWLVFDVDRAERSAFAWSDAHLPPPSWIAVNRESGNAHLGYGLRVPVLTATADGSSAAAVRYLAAIEFAYARRIGADVGYAGLIAKNPCHARWKLLSDAARLFELGELAEYVNLPSRLPINRRIETFGLGRNCTLFEELRIWSYCNLRAYLGRGFNAWRAACRYQAQVINSKFCVPLPDLEIGHIAKSVSRWTWARPELARTSANFSARQAARGARGGVKSGVTRKQRARARRVRCCLRRLMFGHTVATLAEELEVSLRTTNRWLRS